MILCLCDGSLWLKFNRQWPPEKPTGLLGNHSVLDPPDPIPNSEVKRNSADDSVGSPHVKVGHCQAFIVKPRSGYRSGFFFVSEKATTHFHCLMKVRPTTFATLMGPALARHLLWTLDRITIGGYFSFKRSDCRSTKFGISTISNLTRINRRITKETGRYNPTRPQFRLISWSTSRFDITRLLGGGSLLIHRSLPGVLETKQ